MGKRRPGQKETLIGQSGKDRRERFRVRHQCEWAENAAGKGKEDLSMRDVQEFSCLLVITDRVKQIKEERFR
jgi:hypothetical protein